ncbi:MAG TPA: response regulator transcription factor [Vicinamibacterales bacterium]|nr:response regulator transcription factor [Vicinamibacterales bacterium]
MSNEASRGRVLIVEDDPAIRELVRDHLSLAGFATDEVGDGRDALQRVRNEPYRLIILDLMLPNFDGVTLCRTTRAQGVNRDTPILMLTARDTESDKVLGLESGADDYLTKPFGVRELMARVAAILRRSHVASEPDTGDRLRVVNTHGVAIDPHRREVRVRNEPVVLTKQEFDLLYLLARRPGIVFSREALIARVWNGDAFVTERTIDTVVSRIRKKVELDPQDPEILLTAWGIGYKFADLD